MIRLDNVAPLTITFLSGQSNDTQMYFNETGQLNYCAKEKRRSFLYIYHLFAVNLSKYLATDTSKITIPCAPIGRYDILLRTKGSPKRFSLLYTLKQPNRQAFSHYMQPSRIRYENRLQKRQMMLQWDKR